METHPVWEVLAAADPREVCRRSRAGFDPDTETYILDSFSGTLTVSLPERTVSSSSPSIPRLLSDYREHFYLAAPAYLVSADEREITGELIQPGNIPGGEIYRKGAHVLPLDMLASRYKEDGDGFLEAGRHWGGAAAEYGDASCRLLPFPKVPVTIALWLKDDEFPERADLYFDSSVRGQFPPDVLWGLAWVCVDLLLQKG